MYICPAYFNSFLFNLNDSNKWHIINFKLGKMGRTGQRDGWFSRAAVFEYTIPSY